MAILDVVKFDGLAQGDWLVYKHYQDNLVLGTTLIVAEGQNALFVKGGQIADCFTSGTYKLATENLPILRKFASIPTGGQTPFSAEIFYINTTTKMNLPWGLSDPIQLVDPKYGVRLRVRSFGQCSLKVNDSAAFLKNGDYLPLLLQITKRNSCVIDSALRWLHDMDPETNYSITHPYT